MVLEKFGRYRGAATVQQSEQFIRTVDLFCGSSLSELHSSKGAVLMPLNITPGTNKSEASMRKSCASTCVPFGQERSSKGWGQSMT